MTRGGAREGTGRKPDFPGEETRGASFNLPARLLDELKARARGEKRTQAVIVAAALRAYLDEPATAPLETDPPS